MSENAENLEGMSPEEIHRALCVPSIEEQLNALPSSPSLVDFYRSKLRIYETEFARMSDKVNMCKRSCHDYEEMSAEWKRCSDEVFTLQKALSDTQIYLHKERNQVVSLQAENDLLKAQMCKDRKMLNFLLAHCDTSEDQVAHIINEGKAECLQKEQAGQPKEDTHDVLTKRILALEGQLIVLTSATQDQIHSLHHDRELIQMEKEREYHRLQGRISIATDRLSTAHVIICELTSELIALKADFIKKEEQWILEKEGGRQNRQHPNGEMPEASERNLRAQKENILKVFKHHLHNKEHLIKLYKGHCASLENELWELNNSKDQTNEILQAQLLSMAQQTDSITEKYEELRRKRAFEAEGFRNDVKLLRERLQGLERKLAWQNYAVNAPQRRDEIANAREIMNAAKCLERELCMIKSKLMAFDFD